MAIVEYCQQCPRTGYYNSTHMQRIYLREYVPAYSRRYATSRGLNDGQPRRASQKFSGAGWVCPKDREHIKWDVAGASLTESGS